MAGHNKWSKVKHKKAVEDAKKSRTFSKFARLITLEAKRTGGDKNAPALRKVIERARAANMPQENIDRAIRRASGKDAAALEEVVYEAYGPGTTALIISALTDNKNRTVSEVKRILAEHGATLAERGAASWAFTKQEGEWIPTITLTLNESDATMLATLIEALEDNEDVQAVFTNAHSKEKET